MVILSDFNKKDFSRQSSKGNQLKWENNDVWYKADYTGYEGLAEYVISRLLNLSSLDAEEFVTYMPVQIQYKNIIYNGAQSQNFLKDDWQIITLERLFKSQYGNSLSQSIFRIADSRERLQFLVDQVERATRLHNFGTYLSKLITIDALFLNEDRHTHNIAVLMNKSGEYKLCPIFDNGAGLLSDTTMDYPMNTNVMELIPTVSSKTFSFDFDDQLDAVENLYGDHLKFHFNKKDVHELINAEAAQIYSPEVRSRVEMILLEQMRKYRYLFKS